MISRRDLIAGLAAPVARMQAVDDWVPLFDGRSLEGWKPSENTASWKVLDGAIATAGPRSHLFYAGPLRNAEFRNFELRLEFMTRPGANSGVFFHTRFQENGWPEQGFEVQINSTHAGEGSYRERKKTGSLYGVRNVYKTLTRDDEWVPLRIGVRGKNVQIHVRDMLVVDYVEPDAPVQAAKTPGRVLGTGTFALQCHDPGSKALFRNLMVRPLADDTPPVNTARPVIDDRYRQILELSAQNYPVIDYHVHVRGAWTLEDALKESRETGIGYGIAVNGGRNFPITSDQGLLQHIARMKNVPAFAAMQAEGREWVTMFSPEAIAQLDYVFTDAMTWTDDNGKRMRTWLKEEVGDIADPQKFMDMLVERTVGILNREPVDIWANPTYIPDAISSAYDELWTGERIRKVVDAVVRNDVAIELNNRYRIPSAAFIRLAKSMGAKFTFGSNIAERSAGRIDYGLQMVRECGLRWQDFFVPKADGHKAIQKKGLPKSEAV
ncbi:MAG TPA: family 16 glycoside hydrolase [Bryobacteraceae bacterium]|nr:family 16 glycoside hydrolase [Bryobacteraceae bacterium]